MTASRRPSQGLDRKVWGVGGEERGSGWPYMPRQSQACPKAWGPGVEPKGTSRSQGRRYRGAEGLWGFTSDHTRGRSRKFQEVGSEKRRRGPWG